MPDNYVIQISKDTEFICMKDDSYKRYNILENNSKSILINFGNLEDLDISSITGLVAHLFALIDIGYHKETNLSPQEWLKIDLYSDDVARDWGFEKEVNDLRKIRPQKLPREIRYPDVVVNTSIPNKKFESDVSSLLSNCTNPSKKICDKIWYVDKFSVLCDLSDLKKEGVKNIHILTHNYKKQHFERLLQ